jgi:hypothetical protein
MCDARLEHNGFDGLAFEAGNLPGDIGAQMGARVGASEAIVKLGEKRLQSRLKLSNRRNIHGETS